jgi:hypothetical protein
MLLLLMDATPINYRDLQLLSHRRSADMMADIPAYRCQGLIKPRWIRVRVLVRTV